MKTVQTSKRTPFHNVPPSQQRENPLPALSPSDGERGNPAAPPPPGELRRVPLDKIVPSPFQARTDPRRGDWAGFLESVRQQGVVQPGVGREKNGKIELVAGHRRWEASKELKLPDLPLILRVLSDQQAMEIIAVENLQREGLTAEEEGRQYAEWIVQLLARKVFKTRAEAIAHIAGRIGAKRSTVYDRMKVARVLTACPAAKKAFDAGELTASHIVEMAIVPPKNLPGLVRTSLRRQISVRNLRDFIAQEYTRQLNEAAWELADTKLVARAGACLNCPKRSGNIEGMAEGNPNLCCDPGCYAEKQAAHGQKLLKLAEAQNKPVLPPKEYQGSSWKFRDASDKSYDDPRGRTFKQLAKAAGIEPMVTVNSEGKAIEVFKREQEGALLKANKISTGTTRHRSSREHKAYLARQKKEKAMKAQAMAATALILEKCGHSARENFPGLWKCLAEAAYHTTAIDRCDFVAKRRGLSERINDSREALIGWLENKQRTPAEFAGFTLELLCCAQWEGGNYKTVAWHPRFLALCKLFGVKPDKLKPGGEKARKAQKPKGRK